ncbi:MAG: TIR domain-containing protein [Deltaproteobacteria bacterium]|nr:TIR domain-containing protein [Deltaproteobacteria bacterium]
MPEREPEYDVFLSHASEDTDWCEKLAERLRERGVRVWFDKWELKPGDHLLMRLNDGIANARKMVAVWSENYFRDAKVWTLAEGFAQQHSDVLARERPLIPLLVADCNIPPIFRNLISIDFCNPDDFDLSLDRLVEALDLPQRESRRDEDERFREHELDLAQRGRRSQAKGKRFEDEVATLYRLLGWEVTRDVHFGGMQIDLQIQMKSGGFLMQAIVECEDKRIAAAEREQILARQKLVQKTLPAYRWIAVSSDGFDAEARTALEAVGVACESYADLLRELLPLETYVEGRIVEYETWAAQHWQGEDWFIRPNLKTDVTYDLHPMLSYFAKWSNDTRANLLTVLGDLGTGKTTVSRFLTYNLAKSFRDDPLRHPAPVLISLGEVRKEVSLEGIIVNHFSRRGLPGISFPRFEHLVRLGKVVLFFDAFDEMADRVRQEVTRANFRELSRAGTGNGKVVLTCRTHYFKDRTEQAKTIGEGPRLAELETPLYRDLKGQPGAQVVYLQEFDDAQIREYLQKARGAEADNDWQQIQEIYNLKDLAQRPLLLDMIVKSLPHLQAQQVMNAASLYTVYTKIWLEREEQKGRILDKGIKLALMLELAWRLWHEEKDAIPYRDLVPFVQRLVTDRTLDPGDEEAEDIAREMQGASFLKRDDPGNFSFVHRSFMEYFLARKLLDGLTQDPPLLEVLNTRRFDRKIVYFLTLLDVHDAIVPPLQQLLTTSYHENLSENALQLLYWSGRIRCGMEETIVDEYALTMLLSRRLPVAAQLSGANLQGIILESADLKETDLSKANLSDANLNRTLLSKVNFYGAVLTNARIETAGMSDSDLRTADLRSASLAGAKLHKCDFTGATIEQTNLIGTEVHNCLGLTATSVASREHLSPVVQRDHASAVTAVAYSPNGELFAVAGDDGVIRLYRVSDQYLVRVLEGHQDRVQSVAFAPDGQMLASGSSDKSVRLWRVASGQVVRVLEGHLGPIYAVQFAPNGKYLVAAGAAGRLQFWDVQKGETFLYRYAFGPGAWLDLLPDGRFDASPEGMRSLRYTEDDTLNSYAAEDLVKEFYRPDDVKAVLARYVG